MRFIYPSLLIWGTLAAVVLALYLFRRRPRLEQVSTLLFFKSLAKEHSEAAWLRYLKRLISFLLSLLVVVAGVFALARMVIAPEADELQGIVVVMDRSASMAARQDDRDRLQVASQLVRRNVAGLPPSVPVTLIAYDQRPEIILPRSLDRQNFYHALDTLHIRPVAGDAPLALELAERVAEIDSPAQIWHVSDGRADYHLTGDKDITVVELLVPVTEPVNVGITALQVRRKPMEHGELEAFVEVRATGLGDREATLEVALDDKLIALRSLAINDAGSERLLLPLKAGNGSSLRLTVNADDDVLGLDDEVAVRIPNLERRQVIWVSEQHDPFTALALASLGDESGIDFYQATPAVWPPKDPIDLAIFEGWLPPNWPADLPAVVINPPGSLGPVKAEAIDGGGLPLDQVRATRDRHPVLFGVASQRARVTQTAVLEASGGLEPLWVGPSGPILLAGENEGQRLVVCAFEPAMSESLPLMASYPLLIGNAVFWSLVDRERDDAARNLVAGTVVELSGSQLQWDDGTIVPVSHGITELDRLGLWESDGGERGSSNLLAAAETVLPGDTDAVLDEADITAAGGWLSGDLSNLFIALILAMLLTESYLFHRHAVY